MFLRDKVERRYNKMKRELFQPSLSLETTFLLVDQLFTSAKSNFMFKKLFWKVSEQPKTLRDYSQCCIHGHDLK